MATAVIMPKQGQSVESCILTELRKKKGDTVAVGDILFAYETDKASFEEEAKVSGTVLEVFFDEGDEIPVLTRVMVIGEVGETIEVEEGEMDVAGTLRPAGEEEMDVVGTLHSTEGVQSSSIDNILPTSPASSVFPLSADRQISSPRARQLAEKHAIQLSGIVGTGPQGRIIERDVQAVIDTLPKATPLAKAMLQKESMSLPETGTGLAGMARGADLNPLDNSAEESDSKVVPLTNIRKRIAKAMHASLQNSAQLTHHLGADARRILSLRKKVKAAIANGYPTNITLNDMICRATILAIRQFPQVNAHFLGDCTRNFSRVHLGVAVDTERGLMVPVVKNADGLSIQELAVRLKAVADACKKGAVNPDLLASEAASFTVSNLGNYGVEMFTPIINLPQVAILGVNTIVLRPKDLGDGVYEFAPYLGLSLTYDHRALDGSEATRFLKQIAIEIENLDFEL